MRFKTVVRLVMLFALTFCWIFPAICQTENETNLKSSYESMFKDFVKKTESKTKVLP